MKGPERIDIQTTAENSSECRAMERNLRGALRPVEPNAGFADRVLARALAGEKPPARREQARGGGQLVAWPTQRRWLSGAIAAALVGGVFVGGITVERHHEAERRAAAANAQFSTAERVTDQALNQVREQMQRAGVHFED